MKSGTQPSKKATVGQPDILRQLRERIVSGTYPAGRQLPIRSKLERQFNVSRMTIQRVLDQLTDDGFVVARGRNGTFIQDHPPHLCRYGMVFPFRCNDAKRWSPFFEALRKKALELDDTNGRRIALYYGSETRDHETWAMLLKDIEAQRLAGLIFASYPGYMQHELPLTAPGLPRVALMDGMFSGVATVDLDRSSYISKVLDYFVERKRKKVAVLFGSHSAEFRLAFSAGMNARGLKCRPYWMQLLSPQLPEGARNCTHLLMNPNQTERPDALLTADDHFTDYALGGLIDAGVKIGQDIDVVVHSNFPAGGPPMFPVRRIGYDMQTILKTSMTLIDSLRAGKALPDKPQLVSAVFEEEQATSVL